MGNDTQGSDVVRNGIPQTRSLAESHPAPQSPSLTSDHHQTIMKNDVVEAKWKKLLGIILKWKKKWSDHRLIKTKNKREQSIYILQKRYGYTKEKAISELDEHYSKAKLC
jgi:uncharacterized protein YjbJ (UPF0337 family)